MSQDTEIDQEYLFTDKLGSKKLGGMPVLFTTRVTDDTRNERFEEVARRFINITPNVSKEKIEAANKLIFHRVGLLLDQYNELVLSEVDKQGTKEIIAMLVSKLIEHTKYLKPKQTGIFIPFEKTLGSAMPSDDVMVMTVSERLSRYLAIITKVHMDCTPRLVNIDTGAFYPISSVEDLKETLTLMERGASNIRSYLAKAYNEAILRAYKALDGKVKTVEDRDGRIIAQESHC